MSKLEGKIAVVTGGNGLPGIPATGKRFSSVRGLTILELGAGKIRRESDYWDAATFMKQVGLLPSQQEITSLGSGSTMDISLERGITDHLARGIGKSYRRRMAV